jgi:hypothetical protein
VKTKESLQYKKKHVWSLRVFSSFSKKRKAVLELRKKNNNKKRSDLYMVHLARTVRQVVSVEGSGCSLFQSSLPVFFRDSLGKTRNVFGQNIRSLGWNQEPSEHEVRMY